MNKAAEKLFIAQPTLTGAVRDVENELGIQIFHRHIKVLPLLLRERLFSQRSSESISSMRK
jgi:DNA-binding transcriptional LysR family regulator